MKKMRRFNGEGDVLVKDEDIPTTGRFSGDTYRRAREAVLRQSLEQFKPDDTERPRTRRAATMTVRGTGSGRGGQGGPTAAELEREGMRRAIDAAEARAGAEDVMSRDYRTEAIRPDTTIDEVVLPPLRRARMAQAAASAARRPAMDAAFNAAQRAGAAPTRRAMEAMVPSNRAAVDAARRGDAAYQARTAATRQAAERAESQAQSRAAREAQDWEAGPARAPRNVSRPEKPPVRDLDELRMSGDGGAFRKGGMTKKFASGGSVSSASKRGDGIAQRGKTKGRYL